MSTQWNSVGLETLGVLRVQGADAVKFLQGQLSNDVARLARERSQLAGYHNPQGRVIALLRLVQLQADELLAILPRELVAGVAARLQKFILRAKVRLADESTSWLIEGLLDSESAPGAAGMPAWLSSATGGVQHLAQGFTVRPGESARRGLLVRPAAAATLPALGTATARDWQLAAIAAGEPQVYAATSEEFVAQMLNLDVLNAIAFDKGCYTGQEVIARAHYRGRVKRRMQRFVSDTAQVLQPGDAGTLADGRSFKVTEAALRADGRCEFLAVTTQVPEAQAAAPAAAVSVPALQLPLPYALPE